MRAYSEETRNYLPQSFFALLILKDVYPQQMRCPNSTLTFFFLCKLEIDPNKLIFSILLVFLIFLFHMFCIANNVCLFLHSRNIRIGTHSEDPCLAVVFSRSLVNLCLLGCCIMLSLGMTFNSCAPETLLENYLKMNY